MTSFTFCKLVSNGKPKRTRPSSTTASRSRNRSRSRSGSRNRPVGQTRLVRGSRSRSIIQICRLHATGQLVHFQPHLQLSLLTHENPVISFHARQIYVREQGEHRWWDPQPMECTALLQTQLLVVACCGSGISSSCEGVLITSSTTISGTAGRSASTTTVHRLNLCCIVHHILSP